MCVCEREREREGEEENGFKVMTERNLRSEKEIEIANKQGVREGGMKILSSTTFLIHLFINLHQILIAFSFLSHYQNKGRKL